MGVSQRVYRHIVRMALLLLCALSLRCGGIAVRAEEPLLPGEEAASGDPEPVAPEKTRRLRDSRWVFIGDSYFFRHREHGQERSIPEMISRRLHVKAYKNLSRGGCGFARRNYTYAGILRNRPVRRDVTDVFLYGGIYNDGELGMDRVREGIRKTVKAVRRLYPNAVIWYTNCSWLCDSIEKGESYRRRVRWRYPRYVSVMKREGVRIIDQVEDVLYNCGRAYYLSDCHHPSALGARRIARVLAARIRELYS